MQHKSLAECARCAQACEPGSPGGVRKAVRFCVLFSPEDECFSPNLCRFQPARVPWHCLRDSLGVDLAGDWDRLQLVQAQLVVPAPRGDDADALGAGSVEGAWTR